MQIRTIIIDDEDLAVDLIERLLAEHTVITIVGKFYSSTEAAAAIETLKPDLIFSDINMPRLTGVALMKQLTYQPLVIFTTAFSEYAVEAFSLQALDYLVKPISAGRFNAAVEKAVLQFQLQQYARLLSKNEQYITLKKDGVEYKVNYNEISYVEGMRQYIIVHTAHQKFYLNETLKKMETELSGYGFTRVHKSFIVNKTKVNKVTFTTAFLGAVKIPIGRSYKDCLK